MIMDNHSNSVVVTQIAKSRAALEAKEKIAKEERGRLNEEQEVKRIIASYRYSLH